VDEKLVQAVLRQESGGNHRAVSPKGAQGLMQLMPETAALMGVKDAFDPEENVAGGVRYLKHCLSRFKHNVVLTLAAYNAGPEAMEKYQGVPPYRETKNYVASITRAYTQPYTQAYTKAYTTKSRTQDEPQAAAVARSTQPPDKKPASLDWHVPAPTWKIAAPRIRVAAPRWKEKSPGPKAGLTQDSSRFKGATELPRKFKGLRAEKVDRHSRAPGGLLRDSLVKGPVISSADGTSGPGNSLSSRVD